MKVLVTGANGFVGSHIVEELIAAGHQPICMVRKSSDLSWIDGLPVTYRFGDIRNADILPEIVDGIDAVVHAAGALRARRQETYYEINQYATRALAVAAFKHNIYFKKFVYISSQAAMGPAGSMTPKSLEDPETPLSDYGKSKLAGEKELLPLRDKLRYTILRPASVYGPRDKDIFMMFSLVHKGLRPVTLTKRYVQFCFVKDLARAAVKAVESYEATHKTYVVAEQTPYSWEDFSYTIAKEVERDTIELPLPDMAFKVAGFLAEQVARLRGNAAVLNRQKAEEMLQRYWIADTTPSRELIGADFTNLRNGGKITYSWYKNNRWLE